MDRNVVVENASVSLCENEMIKIRGRHSVENGMLAFDWTNSGIAFNFRGTGFILSLGGYFADAPAYVKVIVDGISRQRFAVSDGRERIIVEGLPDKRHRIEVLKVTEGASKLLFDRIALLGQNAAFQMPPYRGMRKLEFIGDSITAGYGVLGRSVDPGYSTYQQDGTYSYAYLTAETFGAEGRYICISGKGIVNNCNGDRNDVKAGEYFDRLAYSGGVCADGWMPDSVIINIGTNDAGGPAPKEEFAGAARELIAKVRARYPGAVIIWLYGMMGDYYADVIKETIRTMGAADKKLHFLYVPAIDDTERGANGHPNVRGQLRASKLLVKKLISALEWKPVPALKAEE